MQPQISKYAIFRNRLLERHAGLRVVSLPYHLLFESNAQSKQADLLRFIMKAKNVL